MIDILTLNYNDHETVTEFINSVKEFKNVGHIVIVDNCSTDDSVLKLKQIECNKLDIITNEYNGGYGIGNNIGIKYIDKTYHTKYILQCNPDVIINESTIDALCDFLNDNENYCIVAPFMLDRSGIRQKNTAFFIPSIGQYILSIGAVFSKLSNGFYYNDIFDYINGYRTVDAVSGSLFMMNTEMMLKYGMYDENMFLYCEEMVLGIKLRKHNIKTALLNNETFVHNHSVSICKSYSSAVKRHKLLMNSKLYVIKKYFNANPFQYFVALMLSKISIFEIYVRNLIK